MTVRGELPWLIAATVAATLVAVWVHHLWDMSLYIPLAAGGDGLAAQTIMRTVVEHGWVGHNPDIGAPFGSSLYDNSVTFGYATQLMIIKLMSILSSDTSALANAIYILGYPLASATAFLVLRSLRFTRAIALVGAVLYATTHYHFMRGGGHLFLGLNYAVPIGCWLIYGALGRVDLFRRRSAPGSRWLAWATPRTALTLLACFIAGTSEVYFAVFTLAILAVIVPVVAITRGRLRAAVLPILLIGAVGGSTIAVQLPQIIWHMQNGANETVSVRAPFESELLSFKLADLVMPVPGHRLGFLDRIGSEYRTATPLVSEGSSPTLGGYATIGFLLGLLAVAAATLAPATRRMTEHAQLLRDSGLLATIAFFIGTIGGGGTLVAYLLTAQVRGWNRISIFIVFFAIVALAVALTWLDQRLRGRGRRAAAIATPLILVIGAIGVWEQTGPRVPNYAGIAAEWRNDSRFVRAIENTLPAESQVLQLPYVPFPEHPPVHELADYEHLRAYIASETTQWSYGASKGREPEDWAATTNQLPTPELVAGAAAAGFEGIYVDRRGYADNGETLLAELASETGVEPIVSEDGQLHFFDLRPAQSTLRSAASPAMLAAGKDSFLGEQQLTLGYGEGFLAEESDGTTQWRWAPAASQLTVNNGGNAPAATTLELRAATAGDEPQRLTVTTPDGAVKTFRTRPGKPTRFTVEFTAPPGASTIALETDAPAAPNDPRDLRLQVFGAVLEDAALAELQQVLDAG